MMLVIVDKLVPFRGGGPASLIADLRIELIVRGTENPRFQNVKFSALHPLWVFDPAGRPMK